MLDMKNIYQAIIKLIEQNSPGCVAVKTYLTTQKRKCVFPLNWCDFVSIAIMSVILDKGKNCYLIRFTGNNSWGDHFCIKKDDLYSDFTINQFPNYKQPIVENRVHPFSKEWDNEKMLDKSAVEKMRQSWPKDVNYAIDKFTNDLREELGKIGN